MTLSLGLFSQNPIIASIVVLFLMIGVAISSYFANQRLKQKKVRLAAVLVANTVAALAIIGLAFDIQITSQQASIVYLITKGTTTQQLEQIDTEQDVFVMRGALKSAASSNVLDVATQIDIPSQILSKKVTFDNLHVLGDGLSFAQWQDLQHLMGQSFNNISVTFSASKPRIGLINIQWPRELAVGQFVEIQGQLQVVNAAIADDIYHLNLLDPVGEVVQTLRLKASERFTLSFPAVAAGQWVYRLQLNEPNNSTLITDEPIAFSVAKPIPLRILIKQSAPSFETRQLKNWAASFGSQISVLTQISQNRDIRQNINLSPMELEKITSPFTAQALDNVDWLLIDGRALLNLTELQMTALETATKNGLGVYIIADNELVNAWPVPALDWLLGMDMQPLDVANYSSIPYWPNSDVQQAMPLLKASITSVDGTSLIQSNNNQILVSQSKIGLGQLAISLINATYGWQTSGLTGQYSHYWQTVIYGLARPKRTPYWLDSPSDALPRLNQRMQRCLIGPADLGVVTHTQSQQTLILGDDLLQAEQHCLSIWPTTEGWHQLVWSQNTELATQKDDHTSAVDTWFYIHSKQDWSESQQTKNHQASENVAQQQNTTAFVKYSAQSINKGWLWGLLVLFMTLLWLERKLF